MLLHCIGCIQVNACYVQYFLILQVIIFLFKTYNLEFSFEYLKIKLTYILRYKCKE